MFEFFFLFAKETKQTEYKYYFSVFSFSVSLCLSFVLKEWHLKDKWCFCVSWGCIVVNYCQICLFASDGEQAFSFQIAESIASIVGVRFR